MTDALRAEIGSPVARKRALGRKDLSKVDPAWDELPAIITRIPPASSGSQEPIQYFRGAFLGKVSESLVLPTPLMSLTVTPGRICAGLRTQRLCRQLLRCQDRL